jgi:hypothetical protein
MVAGTKAMITSHIILEIFPFILMWGETETANFWDIKVTSSRITRVVGVARRTRV